MLTQAQLKTLLSYDRESGTFIWRVNRSASARRGCIAGAQHPIEEYYSIKIFSKKYPAHRLAWLHERGEWPPLGMEIDHIDGDRSNNRFSNLRLATPSQNCGNRKTYTTNQSGLKGVMARRSRFRAQIQYNGVKRHLGTFDTPQEAHAAYMEAAREIFGHFAFHGDRSLGWGSV